MFMQAVSPGSTDPRTALPRTPRTPRTAITVIIVALVMLGSLPILTSLYSRKAREDLRNVIEPARNLVTDIHVSLALGASALRDYLSTKDIKFLRDYGFHSQQEIAASEALTPLATRLGRGVLQNMTDYLLAQKRWHDRVSEIVKGRPGAAESRAILAEDTLYEDAVTAASRLDFAIVEVAAE